YEIKARRIKDYNNQRKILITLKNISKVKVLEEKLEKKEENYQKITNSFPEIQFWKFFTPIKYERAIRTTSEMLKVIIENIPQCVFWKDTNFKYLGCNGKYSEFIGIEHPEGIIGKTDEDLLSNREKIQQIRESETSVMLSGKPLYHTNESWIIEKGESIWLDINRIPLTDTKGDVNGILVTFEEITDRKIAEEKLRNSEKKYKNLSMELETIMDIIPSIIFVKNKSGIYTRVNQAFADYLKLEKEDIIGKSTIDLFPQELATNIKRDDLEVIKNGIPKLNIEETVEFPEGKVSVIISKMPNYNEKDEINGVIGFAIDISERKELEQRLIKSEERYRELANSLPQVIAETDERGNLTFVN
ncbi:MAG: PAS domain S-box protein, partial [Candidatus Lokiarchaeota archaeon]|nr:PAS domain S-box protein [Candidatus Lokiarchaeota archaeon]